MTNNSVKDHILLHLNSFKNKNKTKTLIPLEKLQSAAVFELPDCRFLTPPTALNKIMITFDQTALDRIMIKFDQNKN